MRLPWFGILVLLLCFTYCVFLASRLTRIPEPPPPSPHGPATSVDEVKSDLCKLAAAEHEFHRITGSYARESELRANDIDAFPTLPPWPYHYLILVPAPDAFTIVATHYGPLNNAPAAVVTDASGQVCVVMPGPSGSHQRGNLQPHNPSLTYDCNICER